MRDSVGDGVCGAALREERCQQKEPTHVCIHHWFDCPRVETNHDSQPTRHKLWVELHDGTLGGLGL